MTTQAKPFKSDETDPKGSWVVKPDCTTRKELESLRRSKERSNIEIKTIQGHKNIIEANKKLDEYERDYECEGTAQVEIPLDEKPITKRQLLYQRNKNTKDYNQETFASLRIGLHGRPLPQYCPKENEK